MDLYLGIHFDYLPNGDVKITQPKLLQGLLEEYKDDGRSLVEYGYSILGPVSKRTFVKWCFLEKEKDFPTHFYHPYSFLS